MGMKDGLSSYSATEDEMRSTRNGQDRDKDKAGR